MAGFIIGIFSGALIGVIVIAILGIAAENRDYDITADNRRKEQ